MPEHIQTESSSAFKKNIQSIRTWICAIDQYQSLMKMVKTAQSSWMDEKCMQAQNDMRWYKNEWSRRSAHDRHAAMHHYINMLNLDASMLGPDQLWRALCAQQEQKMLVEALKHHDLRIMIPEELACLLDLVEPDAWLNMYVNTFKQDHAHEIHAAQDMYTTPRTDHE